MSMQVYESDYMSVLWNISNRWDEKNVQEYLYLYINIQVNWKLKTFELWFDLEEGAAVNSGLSLKNWKEWYNVVETLEWMWYNFWDDNDLRWNIIHKWIERLENMRV